MANVDRARLSVRFVIQRLRNNVAQILTQQVPGGHPGPRKWLAIISGLIDTAAECLDQSENNGLSDDQRNALLVDAALHTRDAYRYIDECRGADVSELSYPVIPPLQRWFDDLGLPFDTFFRASLEPNYELRPRQRTDFERPRHLSKSLDDALTVINWPFIRVTVPAKAFGIVPHLAIVSHEIGHALFRFSGFDRNAMMDQHRAEHAKSLEEVPITIHSRIERFEAAEQRVLSSISSRWVEELTADAFMYYLTGPAGFFSLCDFAQWLGGKDGFSKYHPAWFQRRRLLYNQLLRKEAGGKSFADVFTESSGGPLTEDFNSPLLKEPPGGDYIYRTVLGFPLTHNEVEAAVIEALYPVMFKAETAIYAHVKEFLRNRAPDTIYTPERFHLDLTRHLEPMLAAVPPVEFGVSLDAMQPTEFATILNVGWAVLLTRLSDLRVRTSPTSDLKTQKLEKLHSLLLKAVELSEAKRTWMAH